MSEDPPRRPRRAWQSDEDTSSPTVMDDTSGDDIFRPRRGSVEDPPAFARPTGAAPSFALGDEPSSPVGDTPIPAPVFPRSSGEFADSPSPAPRRSALSSTTPVEAEPVAAAPHWFREHRRTLLAWGVGGLALALIVAVVVSLVVRGGGTT